MATKHGLGVLGRFTNGIYEISCSCGEFQHASPDREHMPDIDQRKEAAYTALAEHCVREWRKNGEPI